MRTAWVAAATIAACGGTVTVASTEGAGGAGASAGTGANGSGANGSGAGNVGTGGYYPGYCEDFCAARAKLCGPDPECVQGCQEEVEDSGLCFDELDASLKCLLGAPSCEEVPRECFAKFQAYGSCLNPHSCGPERCSAGGTTGPGGGSISECSCVRNCRGHQQETQCSAQGTSPAACLCLLDGMAVGKCVAPGDPFQACGLDTGCCASFF